MDKEFGEEVKRNEKNNKEEEKYEDVETKVVLNKENQDISDKYLK